MRRMLDKKGYLSAKFPNDSHVRSSFYKFIKLYVKACKHKQKSYKSDLTDKLEHLYETDPKAYWKLLEDLKVMDRQIQKRILWLMNGWIIFQI